ncbi:MAG: FAD:protein FMN transferase [Planctomycetes bacterium]|nr:FAD:protein FMN transferase [Planctomycetota bacterium]
MKPIDRVRRKAFVIAMGWVLGACGQTPTSADGAPAEHAERRFEFERVLMGVPFRIVAYGADAEAVARAARAAFARVKELNLVFSDYDPDSELRRLVAEAPSQPKKISADLARVLLLSRRLWEQSGGAFDPSVGPMVKLWRNARRSGELPTPELLAAARARRGFDDLILDAATETVAFRRPDLAIDLGAIAKGYAADEALAVLRAQGFPRALVDGGGDLSLGEPPPSEPGWRVAVEALDDPERAAAELVLANAAVATSGDAWQYVEIDGVRYAHIIDPETGLGLGERFSVTVIAPTGALADGLATALCVLGPARGPALVALHPGVEAWITTPQGTTHCTGKVPGSFPVP